MSDKIALKALSHWGWAGAAIRLVAARENRVYRVDHGGQSYALRLHRVGYRTDQELVSELQWMAMLAAQGVKVPVPVACDDGAYLVRCDDVQVDALRWMPGETLTSVTLTTALYDQLGQLMAQMHDCADAWDLPAEFSRPTWDLVGPDPLWGRFWENPTLSADQERGLDAFRDEARKALDDLQSADVGLIHADLVPDNVLVHEGALCPIDFDDGGFGHRIFDLATVTFRSRRTDPSGELAGAVVAGYQSVRPGDVSALPLFEALRACTYVGWVVPRMHEAGAAARNQRFVLEAEAAIARWRNSAT